MTKLTVSAVLDRSCTYDSVMLAETTPAPTGERVVTGNQRKPKARRSTVSDAVTDRSPRLWA